MIPFPSSSCTAWEDCNHDGICHDPAECGGIGPNAREQKRETLNLESGIRQALAARKAVFDACPAQKQFLGDRACPTCGATSKEPCREGVRADAIFVHTIKELVA